MCIGDNYNKKKSNICFIFSKIGVIVEINKSTVSITIIVQLLASYVSKTIHFYGLFSDPFFHLIYNSMLNKNKY